MKNVNKHIVVCLGASMVRGQVSYDFVKLLDRRMAEDGFQFINAGVAGDQAYNVLMRLDSIIDYQPDFVIILVGTNDVTATLSPTLAGISRLTKRFPQPPSATFYHDNMLRIVKTLKEKTSAKIASSRFPFLAKTWNQFPINASRNIMLCSRRSQTGSKLAIYLFMNAKKSI